MSRATVSKSRADKTKGSQNAPTPAVAHEVVPGKFNDNDWAQLIDHDDGEEIATDIVGELCDSVLDVIHGNYIQRQLLPYTISQAKDAMLQIVEWYYLARDAGEIPAETDCSWEEDEEPSVAITDCWSQGAVPKQVISPPSIIEETEEQLEAAGETSAGDTGVEDAGEEDQAEPSMATEKQAPLLQQIVDEQEAAEAKTKQEADTGQAMEQSKEKKEADKPQKKKNKFRPYRGRVNSASYKYMHESIEESERALMQSETYVPSPPPTTQVTTNLPASCTSIVKNIMSLSKVQAGRPPGTRDVQYDEFGNVVGVVKINTERLPSHRVKTRFHIVDPAVEAAQARLEAMRTGKFLNKNNKQKPIVITAPSVQSSSDYYMSTIGGPVSTRMTATTAMSKADVKRGVMTPLPPPLIESMDLQPGVVVREGNRVKKGPRTYRKGVSITLEEGIRLQPVTLTVPRALISTSRILEHQAPMVRPLGAAPLQPHPPLPRIQTK